MEIGPLEGEMTNVDTGELFACEVFVCEKCRHVTRTRINGKELPTENPAMCMQSCEGCECDRRS